MQSSRRSRGCIRGEVDKGGQKSIDRASAAVRVVRRL